MLGAAAITLAGTVGVILGVKHSGERSAEPVHAVDLERGSFRGVALGADERDVRRALGEPEDVNRSGPITQAGEDFSEIGGPTLIQSPGTPGEREAPLVLRYEYIAVILWQDEVFGIVLTDPRAATREGVGIGNDLSRARQVYTRMRCGHAVAGEALFGPTPTYPFCTGRIASRRWIWFGRDPIRSIVITTTRMSG